MSVRQETGETGINIALVRAFVLDNLPGYDLVGFANQRDSLRGTGVIQRIGNLS